MPKLNRPVTIEEMDIAIAEGAIERSKVRLTKVYGFGKEEEIAGMTLLSGL